MINYRDPELFRGFNESPSKFERADSKRPEKPLTFSQSFKAWVKDKFGKGSFRRFLARNFPVKGEKTGSKVRKLAADFCFLVFVVCIAYIAVYYVNYRKTVAKNDDLHDGYFVALQQSEEYDTPEKLEKAWLDKKTTYPDADFPEGMEISFAELYALNDEVVGWLTIPNTNISTVILKPKTDPEKYLSTDIYGNKSRYGNPFMDIDCAVTPEGLSKQTVIYGHNTHDGLMFHQLLNYMSADGYKNAPVIILDTLYGRTVWKIFGVMLTNSTRDADNGNLFEYIKINFNSEESFMNVVNGVYARSMIHTGIDVEPDDSILMLYTCYQNVFPGGRLVICARQVREGENPAVDTSGAYYDSSARFPQAYYDKRGNNPPPIY